MISKLPRWVWTGTWALAFTAGTINVVGLLGFQHEPITHLTGTTSMLGAAIASGDILRSLHYMAAIIFFVLGCAISGFIIQDSTLKLGRRYGVALFLVSVLLFLAIPLLHHHLILGIYSAACACGIQNAMISTYSGAVVRTTHISGMFTDLGIFIGHAVRGIPSDVKRLRLCCVVISGFLCGGVVGALVFRFYSYKALLLPACLTSAVAIVYGIYQWRTIDE